MKHKMWMATVLTAVVLIGCSGTNRDSEKSRGYRTVAADPNRDTDRAIQENQTGLDFLRRKKFSDAERSFKAAIQADLMYGPAHNNLGKLYFQQGKLYLAAWEFEYASKLMPHRAEPLNNLGLVYERAAKLDDAVQAYSKAYALSPENIPMLENLTRARVRRGDKGAQVRELLDALIMKDANPKWVSWAREQRALLAGESATTQPLTQPSTSPRPAQTRPQLPQIGD